MARRNACASTLASFFLMAIACRQPSPVTNCETDQNCPIDYICNPALHFCIAKTHVDAGTSDRPLADAISDATSDAASDGALDSAAADAATDGAAADGLVSQDAAAPNCGTSSAVSDDFEAADVSPYLVVVPGDPLVSVSHDSQLVFDVSPGPLSASRAYLYPWFATDLQGDPLVVKVAFSTLESALADSVIGFFEFCPIGHDAPCFGIGQEGSRIFGYRYTGTLSRGAQWLFDLNQHRWWRISAVDSSFEFETSADASSWQSLGNEYWGHPIGLGTFVLGVERQADPGRSVSIAFDDLNRSPGQPTSHWCPASTLTDNFDDNRLGADWDAPSESGSGCYLEERNSHVEIAVSESDSADCVMATWSAFDIRNSEVSVRIIEAPTTPEVMTGIVLWHPELDLRFGLNNNRPIFSLISGGGDHINDDGEVGDYDALHISYHDGGFHLQVHLRAGIWFDMTPSGLTCTAPDGMQIAIGTFEISSISFTTAFTAVLDDFNLVP